MKNLLFVFYLFTSIVAFAQKPYKYWEAGFGVGTLNYVGDLTQNPSTGNMMLEVRPRVGAFLRRSPRPYFSYGMETNWGYTRVEDVNHGNAARGWDVRMDIFNFNVVSELLFVRYGKLHWDQKFTPYMKLGAGYMSFMSYGQNTINLPDNIELHPYAYHTYNVFYGIGARFRAGWKTSISLEFVSHFTGEDRLDGFIDLNAPPVNDRYFGFWLTISRMVF